MEVSKSRKRKSGVEDGDDQPNKKTKTDEAGGTVLIAKTLPSALFQSIGIFSCMLHVIDTEIISK